MYEEKRFFGSNLKNVNIKLSNRDHASLIRVAKEKGCSLTGLFRLIANAKEVRIVN